MKLTALLRLAVASTAFHVFSAHAVDEISVLVPDLQGPQGLSSSVRTILALQVWQTLRRTDAKAPDKDFGKGTVKLFAERPPQNHQSAETLASDIHILSQMVLWGTVQPYGNGAIVQAFLSIPEYPLLDGKRYADFRAKHDEEWTIAIPLKNGNAVFRVDLPRRKLAFEPIVVRREVIEKYSNPRSIPLYDPKNPDRTIGAIGNTFEALEQRGGTALVRSDKLLGLVRLPELSDNRSEIVDFVGGVVRVFRADWQGALDTFARVVENPHTPTDVRIDSYLLRAMARTKLKRPGQEEVQRAIELNPYLRSTITYGVMERLAVFEMSLGSSPAVERQTVIRQARELIERNRQLFLENDAWLAETLGNLGKIEDRYIR